MPTFKAGDEFFLGVDNDLIWDNPHGLNVTAYSHLTLKKFPNILIDWFEEIPEPPKTVWDLKKGDSCWIIYCRADGEVRIQCIQFSRQYDAERSLGLLFLTREEAEKELARYKAEVILRRDTNGFKLKYNLDEKRYYVSYDPTEKELWYGYEDYSNVSHDIVFASVEDAEASIKAHEKEWKTYLGVEE